MIQPHHEHVRETLAICDPEYKPNPGEKLSQQRRRAIRQLDEVYFGLFSALLEPVSTFAEDGEYLPYRRIQNELREDLKARLVDLLHPEVQPEPAVREGYDGVIVSK